MFYAVQLRTSLIILFISRCSGIIYLPRISSFPLLLTRISSFVSSNLISLIIVIINFYSTGKLCLAREGKNFD